MTEISRPDRRTFLKIGAFAGGGLALAVYVPGRRPWDTTGATFQPNVFVRLGSDGMVTIWVGRVEMGQGVRTSLPMIVADELDADWSRVHVVQADAHPTKYGRQGTYGSTSVRNGAWLPLRRAGAAAREMLVGAAAARWGVDEAACRTDRGQVVHDASGRILSYGELADAAGRRPVPPDPRLKDPSEFRLIGSRLPLVDTPAHVAGRSVFGLDVRVPGMLHATVVHPPMFGGAVQHIDATRARDVPGVQHVLELSGGVAVVAEDTWTAFRGAEALDVTWKPGSFALGSADIAASLARLLEQPGEVARDDGDAETALRQAARRIEAIYRAPYLAHATMEPMNCTAHVRPDRCEIWAPTQNPQGTQEAAARLTGLPIERVTVHVTHLGCGWGRRSATDFVRDAVETSMKVGTPVQVAWTREEDMRHDYYRPTACHHLEGAIGADGGLAALRVRIACTPISGGGGGGGSGVDRNSVEGIANLPYRVPNLFVDYCRPHIAVPTGYWRSVGASQNTFIVESFVDELAHAAGRDPLEFRLALLDHRPRLARVLELAAERSGWGTPLAGRARGVALVDNKGGLVAEVAEVSLEGGRLRVHRVTCVADCGRIIHPGIAESQMTGSVVCGLTAALYGEITLEGGRVVQGNFDDYPLLRFDEMPEVAVHLVRSDEEPGGVGEPAVPPIAPAVTNAIFALSGRRVRSLPIRPGNLSGA